MHSCHKQCHSPLAALDHRRTSSSAWSASPSTSSSPIRPKHPSTRRRRLGPMTHWISRPPRPCRRARRPRHRPFRRRACGLGSREGAPPCPRSRRGRPRAAGSGPSRRARTSAARGRRRTAGPEGRFPPVPPFLRSIRFARPGSPRPRRGVGGASPRQRELVQSRCAPALGSFAPRRIRFELFTTRFDLFPVVSKPGSRAAGASLIPY